MLSEKIIVKIRSKPLNPKIILNIENNNHINVNSYLADNDFDYLSSDKREFVKTVLPIIINKNQSILLTRNFLKELKIKLQTFKTLDNNEVQKLNKLARNYNIKFSNKHKLDVINNLLLNVDIIPNSIALAKLPLRVGGENQDLQLKIMLFGEYTDQNQGVIPLERELGATHLIKSFNSTMVCIIILC